MFICKYCSKECKNVLSLKSHEHKCPQNENRVLTLDRKGKPSWNKGLTKETSESVAMYSEKLKIKFESGELEINGCCAWDTETRSLNAKKQGFGGYRKNAGHSKKFYVNDSFGNEVCLQSSYELECSIILNDLNVKWIRPKALNYTGKRYFADFYLMDFDIYLDPKNNYKAKLDEDKIEKVMLENNVKIFVLLKEMLTHEYIMRLIQP